MPKKSRTQKEVDAVKENILDQALQLIEEHESPAIVYTSTRKNAEELSDYLKLHNINCNFYHAGLSSEMRKVTIDIMEF